MSVQMKYDLAYALTIMLTLTFSEDDYEQVPKVDCGTKKLQQKYFLPVIVTLLFHQIEPKKRISPF